MSIRAHLLQLARSAFDVILASPESWGDMPVPVEWQPEYNGWKKDANLTARLRITGTKAGAPLKNVLTWYLCKETVQEGLLKVRYLRYVRGEPSEEDIQAYGPTMGSFFLVTEGHDLEGLM